MSAEKNWKKPGSDIEFIRPAELSEKGFTGVLVEGILIESLPNHFDNTKLDFKFEKDDGGTLVINGAGNLTYRMKNVSPGDYCRVDYLGKRVIESGTMKGKESHNFEVLVADGE